jgi:hypothetical protein
MIPEPLDDAYLTWLYRQVASVRYKNPSRTYWSLFRKLYSTEFVWYVPNDDNRVEDGRELRYEFQQEEDVEIDEEWLHLGCSMLEMLIALSRRLAFEADGQPRTWFWHLLRNIQLEHFTDLELQSGNSKRKAEEIDDILGTVIWRRYRRDGSEGGLFPLRRMEPGTRDQRKVELWYQAAAYLQQ